MQYLTKLRLAAVHQICDAQDKSTEFMLEFMQDACNVNLDCALAYFELDAKEKADLFKDVNNFVKTMVIIEATF